MTNHMARNAHHEIRQHDTLPAMATTFLDADGNARDVSNDTISVEVANQAGNVVISGTATVADGPSGKVKYEWADGDTKFAGDFKVLWRAETTNGETLSHPTSGYESLSITPSFTSG